jgi:hypothetical protein
MEWRKLLIDFGFRRMESNWDGSPVPKNYEQYHLYLAYSLIVELYHNRFYILDSKGNSVGPIHSIYELPRELLYFESILPGIKERYREYQLNKII